MPQKVIKFTGINRKINEFQDSGACEEMINIRPSFSGLEIVKPKKKKFNNADYDIYTHTFGDNIFYIAVLPEAEFKIYSIKEDGSVLSIDSFERESSEYNVCFIGNKILLSNGASLRVYSYANGSYTKEDAVRQNDYDIEYSVTSGYGYSQEVTLSSADPSKNEFKNLIMEHWSAAMGQNSKANEIFGPILVAMNFTLSDGTEFWTNRWTYINPFLYLPNGSNGKKMVYYEDGNTKRITFDSFAVTLKVKMTSYSDTDAKNLVEKINIYCTRPVFPYDIDSMYSGTGGTHDREIYANAVGVKQLGITDQLLYFQNSLLLSDVVTGGTSVPLDFRNQMGEKVLEVDNGPVKRTGKMVSLNNRAHVYDSYVTLQKQPVLCMSNCGGEFQSVTAYVYLECGSDNVIIQTTARIPNKLSATDYGTNVSCFYPDARAKRIYIATPTAGKFGIVYLEQSSRYNFAWGEVASYTKDTVNESALVETSNVIREVNSINVSAQYNPFVFPVNYSYSVGGKILDMATSYLPISSTQISQYPLTIFTSNGIFALEQGTEGVLYGGVTPLQPLVIDGKSVATPSGIFFVSSNNIYVLSGREAANVSYILNGKLESNLKDVSAYKKLYMTGDAMVDFTQLLSKTDFEKYITNAHLTFDQLHNELYISSNDENIKYSYVFNIDTKAYHKVSKKYFGSQNETRYVIEATGNNRSVVDLYTEEEYDNTPIFLQSRPMSLETFNTHIQRLILLADAKLTGNQNLCISVFASDNLHDWKCIISSQKHNTILRHIRTNRAAKSYRDYVIIISGTVDTDTDISDLIADYTAVSRRLG